MTYVGLIKKSSDVPDILDVALQTYPFPVHIYVREHPGHVLARTVGQLRLHRMGKRIDVGIVQRKKPTSKKRLPPFETNS